MNTINSDIEREKCARCVYALENQEGFFICRRNPPTPYPVQVKHPISGQTMQSVINARPVMQGDDFCGEFADVIDDFIGGAIDNQSNLNG